MKHWQQHSIAVVVCCVHLFSSLLEAGFPVDIPPNVVLSNTKKTTQGSAFMQNLNVVFGYLYKQTPVSGSADYGFGKYPDVVFGHCECYNMTIGDCGQCFNSARDMIEETAPLAIGAQYWMNNSNYRCYLRYENYNFMPGYVLPDAVSPASPPRRAAVPTGSNKGRPSKIGVIVGVSIGAVALLSALALVVFCCFPKHLRSRKFDEQSSTLRQHDQLEGSFEGPQNFHYEDLRSATKDFSEERQLGRGGFGPVYKGVLDDGSEVAIKKLSLQSSQGKQEFMNEVNIITGVQQRNLARLRGYCIKGDERLLVYEFLENGSLDQALFNSNVKVALDWPTRLNIAIGIARGLAYLHEESHVQIIHRDIKASNILLDKDLSPKISDFGISKLFDVEKTSVNTRVAGTYGYMAPEYAIGGRLTVKADVFSFGVLILELVSGRKCRDSSFDPENLLEWVWVLYENGNLEELVDKRFLGNYSREEVLRLIHVALLCTHENEVSRPTMTDVVAMLLGYLKLSPLPTKSPWYLGLRNYKSDQSMTGSSSQTGTFGQSSDFSQSDSMPAR